LLGTPTLGPEYGDTDEKTPYEAILTSHPLSVVSEGVELKDARPPKGVNVKTLMGLKTQDAKTLDDTTTQGVKRYFQPSSDASFADNPDRKSSHSFLFKLFKGPIA
jgi:hypothetical protein